MLSGAWEIASTTYYHFYCKVKVGISAQCFTHPASKSGKSYNGEQSDKVDSAPVMHTRVLLLPPEATRLTKSAFAALKKDHTQPSGASRAYHESQSRIYKLEAPLFVGVGEGTDNMDFLADLSALKVIDPEEVTRAKPSGSDPVPRSESLTIVAEAEAGRSSLCSLCLVQGSFENQEHAGGTLLFYSPCCAPTILLRTTISVPDHHGKGVAIATTELWFFLHTASLSP